MSAFLLIRSTILFAAMFEELLDVWGKVVHLIGEIVGMEATPSLFTLTETTAGFTRSTTVAKDGRSEVCKSEVTTATAIAGVEVDIIEPPIAPEATIATTAANICPGLWSDSLSRKSTKCASVIGMIA